MLCILPLVFVTAQVPSATSQQSLERVRKGLEAPPPALTVETDLSDITRPRFRLSIDAVRPLYLNPPWEPDEAVPSYVRAPHPLYHQEFLSMVTPEEFRAGTVVGGIDLFALLRGLSKDAQQARLERERRVREQVKKELELFKAANGIP